MWERYQNNGLYCANSNFMRVHYFCRPSTGSFLTPTWSNLYFMFFICQMSVKRTLSSPLQQGTHLCIDDMLKFFGGKNRKSLNVSGVPIWSFRPVPVWRDRLETTDQIRQKRLLPEWNVLCELRRTSLSQLCAWMSIQLKLKQIYDNSNNINKRKSIGILSLTS